MAPSECTELASGCLVLAVVGRHELLKRAFRHKFVFGDLLFWKFNRFHERESKSCRQDVRVFMR